MKATKELQHEHEIVKQALSILANICEKSEREGTLHVEHLEKIFEFLCVFVDRCHHSKEEETLFPVMEREGGVQVTSMIAQMLTEHQQGRDFIQTMRQAVEKYQAGNSEATSAFRNAARAYIELLRSHIDKEDNVLYLVADRVIADEQQQSLLEAFERIEQERIGEGKHEEFHQLIHTLTHVYNE